MMQYASKIWCIMLSNFMTMEKVLVNAAGIIQDLSFMMK